MYGSVVQNNMEMLSKRIREKITIKILIDGVNKLLIGFLFKFLKTCLIRTKLSQWLSTQTLFDPKRFNWLKIRPSDVYVEFVLK